jgi:hypothetical protein
MINRLVDGICKALASEFGEDVRIYTEKVEQGFTRPALFAEVVKSELELFRGDRYYLQTELNISYYPKRQGRNEDMCDVALRLSEALDVIELDGEPLRRTGASQLIEGDRVVSNAHYDFFVRYKPDNEDNTELMWEDKLIIKEKGAFDE